MTGKPWRAGHVHECGAAGGSHVANVVCVRYAVAHGDKDYVPELASDLVNHPPHYKDHPSGVECITIAEGFNYNKGNAIKYLWRAGKKGDAVPDLKKARWYIDREIQRVEVEWANRDKP